MLDSCLGMACQFPPGTAAVNAAPGRKQKQQIDNVLWFVKQLDTKHLHF